MGDRSREWLENMLAYAMHLLVQANDQHVIEATTGPEDDPDRYDLDGLVEEVRKRYPQF